MLEINESIMILLAPGHEAIAQAIKNNTFHLAWGRLPTGYPAVWQVGEVIPTSDTIAVGPEDMIKSNTENWDLLKESDPLSVSPRSVDSIYKVYKESPSIIYTQEVDYILDTETDIDGTFNVIRWLINGDKPDPLDSYKVIYRVKDDSSTELLEEVGRRIIPTVEYCVPDPQGQISANKTRWSVSGTVTRWLWLQVVFDPMDGIGNTIHQTGLFLNTVPAFGHTTDDWLDVANIDNPGILFKLENHPPRARNSSTTETYNIVIPL